MHSVTKCHPNLSYPWTQGTTGSQLFHPICPCCMCKIQAIRDITGGGTTYYTPLCQPCQHGLPATSWDPRHLPYRKQEHYQGELEEIKSTSTKKQSKELSQIHGLNGECSLLEIPSLRWAVTFPHDFMHLMFENHFKNKIHMWSGNYKGLSSGQEDYEIEMAVWEQIGCETSGSVPFIPSTFSHALPNIAMELRYYTAEDLCFWLLHIGPVWANWTFIMECWCRSLLPSVKSR